MSGPDDPTPGTPEAAFRTSLAEMEAAGEMDRPRPRPSTRLRIAAALAWIPFLALGYGVGRWRGW